MAEELTRSLTMLAERGVPRGAAVVLEDARAEATGEVEPDRQNWRTGLAVALGTAALVLALVGAFFLVARPFGTEEIGPATTVAPVVPTTLPAVSIPGGSEGGLNDVNDLAVSPDGTLWVATSTGVVQWHTSIGDYVAFTEEDGIPARAVKAVSVAPDGVVWAMGDGWLARYQDEWVAFSAIDVPELSGDLGPFTVDSEGAVWIVVGAEELVTFDGEWTRVGTVPAGIGPFSAGLDDLAFDPAGRLWLESEVTGLAVFDGENWRRFDESDGAPRASSNLAVTNDGAVWVGDPEWYEPDRVGIGRFDGSTWENITVADGLLANEGGVFAAPDGTVWVLHDDGVSHFDGQTWTKTVFEEPVEGDLSAAADATGMLWVAANDAVLGFEASGMVTQLAIPEQDAVPGYPVVTLRPVSGEVPRLVSTVIGDLEFTTFRAPPGHTPFSSAPAPFGAITFDGNVVRQSSDGLNWSAVLTGLEQEWVTVDGEKLIVFGDGFLRYEWDGQSWVLESDVDLPGEVQDIGFAEQGVVALVDNTVYYSTDGVDFVPAEAGPVAVEPAVEDKCALYYSTPAVAGDGIGPLLVTDAGFVILSPAGGPDWGRGVSDLCEPLVWFSEDGNRWELQTSRSPFGESAEIEDVASHAGRFVAIGGTSDPEETAVWMSSDGIEWQLADVPELEIARGIAGGELGWFLSGMGGDHGDESIGTDMWFSVDGLTWDGPYPGPDGLAWVFFRTEPSVGRDVIYSVNGTHDGLVVGRLED